MKYIMIAAALAAIVLAGCSSPTPEPPADPAPTETTQKTGTAVQVAYDKGSIKVGDKANCVMCSAEGGGHGEEPAAETIDWKDKTYAFCNKSEKAEFISNPEKYAKM